MPIGPYLNQTATLKGKESYDVYGKPVTSAGVSIRCRIQGSKKRMVGENGQEFVADAEMWVLPGQSISNDDVVTWDSDNYKVVKVETKKNLRGGTDHKKVFLQRTKE